MDPLTDYAAYRSFNDRAAELRREADTFRLTRVLAEQHAALFPRARRLAAGLTGLAASGSRPGSPRRRPTFTRSASTPQPCGC